MIKIKKLILDYRLDLILIIGFILLFLLFSKNFAILNVSGNSMAPTYVDGQFVLIKKHKVAENGDLIVFTAPQEWNSGNISLLKRIIAQDGDEIQINKKEIIINGIAENNGKDICENIYKLTEIKLYKNEFLVAGDNRANSNDGIYHYCAGSVEYKIRRKDVSIIGTEVYVLGGMKR